MARSARRFLKKRTPKVKLAIWWRSNSKAWHSAVIYKLVYVISDVTSESRVDGVRPIRSAVEALACFGRVPCLAYVFQAGCGQPLFA